MLEIPVRTEAIAIKNGRIIARWLIYISIILLGSDTLYRICNGITYQTRAKCIIYANLPRWAFVIYEHVIELSLIVLVGIFVAAMLERYFSRMKKVVPTNPFLAFVYASIIPVCSCGAVPLIGAARKEIPFYTVMTFVIATPLLNPYIIMLSITVLGIEYAILRIVSSLILAVTVGRLVHSVYLKMGRPGIGISVTCDPSEYCIRDSQDVFSRTLQIFKKVLPFLLVASLMSIALEMFSIGKIIQGLEFDGGLLGTVLVVAVGVPVYFCNGADVLFLQPLIEQGNLPLGMALAFSLTSTSVCITSLALLIKYIGKKLTLAALAGVVVVTLVIGISVMLIQKLQILL